jgi:hypothetical protein
METAKVKIDNRFGEQFVGDYEFRQITQGEYERVLVSYMDAAGKVPKQDILKVNRECLFLALVSQPASKPLYKDLIVQGRLPYGLSLKLQEVYDRINGIEMDEQRFLSSPSEESSQTPDLPSSSCVSGSDGQKPSTMPQADRQL